MEGKVSVRTTLEYTNCFVPNESEYLNTLDNDVASISRRRMDIYSLQSLLTLHCYDCGFPRLMYLRISI